MELEHFPLRNDDALNNNTYANTLTFDKLCLHYNEDKQNDL